MGSQSHCEALFRQELSTFLTRLKQTAFAGRWFAILEQTANRFASRLDPKHLSFFYEMLFFGVVDVLFLPVLDTGLVSRVFARL